MEETGWGGGAELPGTKWFKGFRKTAVHLHESMMEKVQKRGRSPMRVQAAIRGSTAPKIFPKSLTALIQLLDGVGGADRLGTEGGGGGERERELRGKRMSQSHI